MRANGVAGTPDEVVERLRAFADIGAGTVYLQVLDLDDLDHIRLLSEAVLPHRPQSRAVAEMRSQMKQTRRTS